MVTFSTNFQKYSAENIYSGKAMDNRLACYILCSLAEKLENVSLPYNLYFAFTSSEEVGIRGAKTATQLINPDIVYVIDVATASNQLKRDHSNKRQVGKGPMITLFDRTLSQIEKWQIISEILHQIIKFHFKKICLIWVERMVEKLIK